MKRTFTFFIAIITIFGLFSCTATQKEKVEEAPLNISIFLDLSDRLVRDLSPCQMYRDTAIINFLVDYFKQKTLGPQILTSKNRMKVLFYPTPKNSEVSVLTQGLNVDIGSKQGIERRQAVDSMKAVFQRNLSQIYQETLDAQDWIGCDIWDFFSSKKVDVQCMRPDARNVLVILTDGYLYDANHKIKEGNAFSYLLPQTLAIENSSLIVKRQGLENLEVLVLEVNPYHINQRDRLVSVLEDWFFGMGVKKFVVAETEADITNTKTIIRNFLDN